MSGGDDRGTRRRARPGAAWRWATTRIGRRTPWRSAKAGYPKAPASGTTPIRTAKKRAGRGWRARRDDHVEAGEHADHALAEGQIVVHTETRVAKATPIVDGGSNGHASPRLLAVGSEYRAARLSSKDVQKHRHPPPPGPTRHRRGNPRRRAPVRTQDQRLPRSVEEEPGGIRGRGRGDRQVVASAPARGHPGEQCRRMTRSGAM